MHNYDEGHSHFHYPWAYLVNFKDAKTRARWYRTSAEIEIELHKRIHRTKSGKPALLFFDASTMMNYQMPSRADETTYCRKEITPWECEEYRGINPDLERVPMSHLEVRKSSLGEFAGRGLFATQDVPKGSTFDVNASHLAFHILPSTWSVIDRLSDWADHGRNDYADDELDSVVTFIEGVPEMLLFCRTFCCQIMTNFSRLRLHRLWVRISLARNNPLWY